MTPSALLADFRLRGFTLTAVGGRLRVAPGSGLTPADRESLACHWREVTRILSDGGAGGIPPPESHAPGPPVWAVLASTDPAAVGGTWVGGRWCPPAHGANTAGAGATGFDRSPAICDNDHNGG